MALDFRGAPDWLLQDYMRRKTPYEEASTGLQTGIANYLAIDQSKRQNALAEQTAQRQQQKFDMDKREQFYRRGDESMLPANERPGIPQGPVTAEGVSPQLPSLVQRSMDFLKKFPHGTEGALAGKNTALEDVYNRGETPQSARGRTAPPQPKSSSAPGVAQGLPQATLPGKMLPAPTVLALNEGKNVARMMPDVEAAIKQNMGKYGPITGRIATANPYDTGAQTFDARMRTASQAFGRFMEGGVLRKEDEAKYLRMFPQASDKDDVKKNKLSIVRRTLAQKYEDDKSTLGASGYDISGFGTLEIPPSIFEQSPEAVAGGTGMEGLSDEELQRIINGR